MTTFTTWLLNWYAQSARKLPWRGAQDAYAIWVSEIMLQQTRVETVIPYYEQWMRLFPSVQALAAATQQSVLAAWEGLGYYSRARNLHLAAQTLMVNYDGRLPHSVDELRKLPGIGQYTAAAIASIAFNQDEPALDGNIRRVMARVFNVELPARSPAGEKQILTFAAAHLPQGQAGDYNQALMDLGATICLPHAPLCSACPVERICLARQLGIQEMRPILKKKPSVPHYTVTAAVVIEDHKVFLAQRPSNRLLGGLWEFPGGKLQEGEDLQTCLKREIKEELAVDTEVDRAFGIYKHAYTHFRVTLHAFCCHFLNGSPQALEAQDIRWVPFNELQSYPMGKIDRQIARQLLQVYPLRSQDG
jgi:A/G-specific adenine glycosylase